MTRLVAHTQFTEALHYLVLSHPGADTSSGLLEELNRRINYLCPTELGRANILARLLSYVDMMAPRPSLRLRRYQRPG